jgi:hypothetical protein
VPDILQRSLSDLSAKGALSRKRNVPAAMDYRPQNLPSGWWLPPLFLLGVAFWGWLVLFVIGLLG